MLVGGDRRIAAQHRQHALQPRAHDIQPIARDRGVVLRLLQLGGGDHAGARQLLLALGLALQIVRLALHLAQLAARLEVAGAGVLHLDARRVERRLRLVEGKLIRHRVEPQQQFAGLHRRVVTHRDGDDATGDLRRDLRDVGLHIGIVGADVATALLPDRQADAGGNDGNADEQKQPQNDRAPQEHRILWLSRRTGRFAYRVQAV